MTKYKLITKHEHPNAHADGRLYEHVFIMTEILGRALTALEVVHHVDEDPRNNAPSNLQLFATDTEHKRHHMRLRAMQEYGNPNYRKCPLCKTYDDTENMVERSSKGTTLYLHKACANLAKAKSRAKKKAAICP